MISEMNILLSVVIVALGLLGVILSFLVVDKTKNLIALIVSGLIILTGVFHYISIKSKQWRVSRNVSQVRKMLPTDIEQLRKNLEQNKPVNPPSEKPASAPKGKK